MEEQSVILIIWFGIICFSLSGVKAILIGSDFSFKYWYKYGKEYWNWYNNRETFSDYKYNRSLYWEDNNANL